MKLGQLVTLATLALAPACAAPEGAGPPRIDEPAREYAAATLEGDTISLQSLRGQVVLLNLWATWCTPCRMETPYLQSLFEEHESDGFEIVGISMDTGDAADRLRDRVDDGEVSPLAEIRDAFD